MGARRRSGSLRYDELMRSRASFGPLLLALILLCADPPATLDAAGAVMDNHFGVLRIK